MPESLTTIMAPVVLFRMIPPVTGVGGMSLTSSVCCSSDWMQMFGSAGLPASASGGVSPTPKRQPLQMGLPGSPCSNSTHTPAPGGGTMYTPIGGPVGPASGGQASHQFDGSGPSTSGT